MNLDFISLQPEAFGLDISDRCLRIAKLKKKRRFLELTSWGEIKIKSGIIEKGEIKDEARLVELIKEGLAKLKGKKLKTKYVVASLPERESFFQVIQMPIMKKEELKTAVLFEAENYIPFSIEEVYLDFQIVPPFRNHLDHLDVLIAALPKTTIDSYLSCLKKAGLIPLALEVESQSISRALIKDGVTPFPIAIIDFGRSRTTFIIFSGYSLRFTSSIAISSQELTQSIAQNLKIDLAEAEKLKLKYGLKAPRRTEKAKKVSKAMLPALTKLTEQVQKYINYYHTHNKHEHLSREDRKIKKILLCGRGANLKGLTDFLSQELKISVELGNPWVNILPSPLKEVPRLPFKESLGYTTALGLALRGTRRNVK